MSLLRWPRRSLLYVKVPVGVTLGNNANGDYYTNKQSHGHGNACWGNAYGYFCAYSALCPRRGHTWGVAPGFILLRLQRVLLAEPPPRHGQSGCILPQAGRGERKTDLEK